MAANENERGARIMRIIACLGLVVYCTAAAAQTDTGGARSDGLPREERARPRTISVKDLPGRPLLIHNPMAALHHHTQQRSQTKLRTTVQDVPTDLELNVEASGKSHYLVRVQHPPPPNMMQDLKVASGDKYLQYIPYDTYIVAMEFHMKSRVEAVNGVESVYHLPAGMKISPALDQLMVKTKNMLPSNAKDVFINADPMHPEKRGNTHFHDRDPMDHPRNRFNSATQEEKHMKQTRVTNKGSSGNHVVHCHDVVT